MLKIEDPSDPTKEIEVYTSEELAEKETALVVAQAEIERLGKVTAEKTENFKKLHEMTEQEKASLSAEKIENLKRIEAAEAKAASLEEQINGDAQKRIANDKETALSKFHGGNAELKKALEDNYELINMQGTDTATINARAQAAVNMYNGSVGRANPLMASYGGGAPVHKDVNRTEEFMKSDKAKNALKMMGEKVD